MVVSALSSHQFTLPICLEPQQGPAIGNWQSSGTKMKALLKKYYEFQSGNNRALNQAWLPLNTGSYATAQVT